MTLTQRLLELTFTAPRSYGGERKVSADGWKAVRVSVPKIDASWSTDQGFYIGHAGSSNTIGNRYPKAIELVKSGGSIDRPELALRDGNGGGVCFVDGRHRFAAMRDLGIKSAEIMVPEEQADEFRRRFS